MPSNTSVLVVQAFGILHSDESYGVYLGSTVLRNFLVLVEELAVVASSGRSALINLPCNLIILCFWVELTVPLFFVELSLI